MDNADSAAQGNTQAQQMQDIADQATGTARPEGDTTTTKAPEDEATTTQRRKTNQKLSLLNLMQTESQN